MHGHTTSRAILKASLPRIFGFALILFAVSAYAIQEKQSTASSDQENKQEAAKPDGPDKYAPLVEEFFNLESKLEQGVSFPAPRTQSKLMPLVPASTQIFASLPNFGEAVGQADQILHQQLDERKVLADWWNTQGGMAGVIVEEALAKVQQFSGYLGDEIVIAGTTDTPHETVLLLAEIHKPGLRAFLQQLVTQYGGQGNSPVVLLSPQQLLQETRPRSTKPLLVLVRPDYMIASSDLSILKSVNATVNRGGAGNFASSPFGQRIAHVYQSGAGVIFAIDLQSLSKQRPHGSKDQEALYQRSGFDDLRFLTVNGQYGAGMLSGNAELTFSGPRQGAASWLAAPAPVGGLDFVSAEAGAAGAFVLKSPALLFDEIKSAATGNDPKAASDLAETEAKLKINFKEDLASKLGNQVVIAVDGPVMPTPAWKVVLQVSDPAVLQRTLKKLVDAANAEHKENKDVTLAEQTEDGVTYHTMHFVNKQKDQDVIYAFSDGYMVLAPTRQLVAKALAIHHNGQSLAKSSNLQALLPDSSGTFSALVYQNVAPLLGPMLALQSPEMGPLLEPLLSHSKPSVTVAYGEDTAIRIYGRSHGFDMTMMLAGAAVAIPNLMNSRKAANDATAVSTVRTLNTAQATYSVTYARYAPDIATLGPGAGGGNCSTGDGVTEQHACLIEGTFAKPDCTADTWCAKGAYRYNTTALCKDKVCEDYVIVATPADAKGAKSFCSTSDGVVRSQQGPPLNTPVTVEECQSWPPQ